MRRYHFDGSSMRCLPFQFSGCGGNSNNFLTLRSCNEACLLRTTAAPPPVPPRAPVDTQRLLGEIVQISFNLSLELLGETAQIGFKNLHLNCSVLKIVTELLSNCVRL